VKNSFLSKLYSILFRRARKNWLRKTVGGGKSWSAAADYTMPCWLVRQAFQGTKKHESKELKWYIKP
jgi:hypothetical protein